MFNKFQKIAAALQTSAFQDVSLSESQFIHPIMPSAKTTGAI